MCHAHSAQHQRAAQSEHSVHTSLARTNKCTVNIRLAANAVHIRMHTLHSRRLIQLLRCYRDRDAHTLAQRTHARVMAASWISLSLRRSYILYMCVYAVGSLFRVCCCLLFLHSTWLPALGFNTQYLSDLTSKYASQFHIGFCSTHSHAETVQHSVASF